MKKIFFLIIFCIGTASFSQKIDWINAPINPIAFKYKLDHYQLRDDVYFHNNKYFDKKGLLIKSSIYSEECDYFYQNEKLYKDSNGSSYNYDIKGNITRAGSNFYEYSANGLLIKHSFSEFKGKKTDIFYSYDSQNRLINMEVFSDGKSQNITTYTYHKKGELLQVVDETFENGILKHKNTSNYKKGRKVFVQEAGSNIDTKIEYKFDANGNSIQEDYIQNNGVHDTFKKIIIYYSVANKNSSLTVDNSSEMPSVFRNGNIAYDIAIFQLENTADGVFYDFITSAYYRVNNIYGSNVIRGSKHIPQKLFQNKDALLYNSNKLHVYFRGDKLSGSSNQIKAVILLNSLMINHSSNKIFASSNFRFDDFTNKKDVLYAGYKISPLEDPLFYTKTYQGEFGLTSSFKFVAYGESKSEYAKVIDYLKNEKDLLIETRQDYSAKYVLPGYADASENVIYQARIYYKEKDGEIASTNTALNSNNDSETLTSNSNAKPSCISGNCKDGFGTLESSTSTITGFFSGGQAQGYGKEVFLEDKGSYEGNLKNGLRDGFGTYYWPSNEQYYHGQWKDGYYHGYGYFRMGMDVLQAGYYENGKQITNYLNQNFINKQFIGKCMGDCVNGFGLLNLDNGDKYIGFFTNEVKSHIGSYLWQTGSFYIGEYVNNIKTGQGMEFYDTTETIYYGEFLNGKRQGLGAYFNKSGTLESKGSWENGILKTSF